MNYNLLADILQDKVNQGPLTATIHITSQCNLNCEYCWYHNPKIKNNKTNTILSLKTIKKIVDELNELNIHTINISGEGEPSLHPQINEIINYIKKSKIKLCISTNLTFQNKDIIAAFAKCDSLVINFSSPAEKIYLSTPSKDKDIYKSVIRNLKLFSKIYHKRKKPALNISYIVTRNNYSYIKDMLKLIDQLEIPNIYFKRLSPVKSTEYLKLTEKMVKSTENLLQNLLYKKNDII